MLQNRLVLNDGTEIINGTASKSSKNELMIRIPGNDIPESALLFSDPSKTEIITCYNSAYKYVYTGYTVMYIIQYFEDGDYVELWLRPENGVEPSMYREAVVPEVYIPLG